MPEYCVTGGTGFIGAHLAKSLLEKGHFVRTTVRNPGKVSLGIENGAKERLMIFKGDLLVEGNFEKAIKGVDGVFHAAFPVLVPLDHNIQVTLIESCVKGTLNVLRSCSKSISVKRVVLTSSCSTIRYCNEAQQESPLNESHWSDLDYCKDHNVSALNCLLFF